MKKIFFATFFFFLTVDPTQCCLELFTSFCTFMLGLPNDKKRFLLLCVINLSEVCCGKGMGKEIYQ